MAIIESDTIRMVIGKLKVNSVIINNISKNNLGQLSIRPRTGIPTGMVLPGITVDVTEDNSEPVFPAAYDTAIIRVWTNPKLTREDFAFRKMIIEEVVDIFNRKADDLNEIDITTNTGYRAALMLKESVVYGHDEEIDRNYGEVMFRIVRSENESFSPNDAGNKSWV